MTFPQGYLAARVPVIVAAMLFVVVPSWAQTVEADAKAAAVKAAEEEGHSADAQSGPNPLAWDPDLAIWTLIVFLILLWILNRFAWPQISAAIDERERKIAESIAAAHKLQEDAKRVVAEHEAKLAAAAGEVRALLEEARRDAEHTKASIVAEAKKAAEAEAERAKRDINRAKEGAIQELAEATASVATELAGHVVSSKLTAEENNQLVREAMAKLAVAAPSKNQVMSTDERENSKHDVVMDVTAERIARVYAQAFIGVAAKSPQAETLVDEVGSLAKLLESSPRLEELFRSSLISPEDKERMLDRLFVRRVSPPTLNFLKVLSKHDRLGLLRDIARLVNKLDAERRGLVNVEVRAARDLASDIRLEIHDRLKKVLGREPVLQVRVDKDLIAGIWVRVGDRVYDGSIRTQLEQTRRSIIERATELIETQPLRFLNA